MLLGLALLLSSTPGAQAASVTDLYLLSTFSTILSPTDQSDSGGIDSGEPGLADTRVNSEVGRLDDVGFVSEGSDAALNIDFGSHAKVILKIPTGGFTSLMIAEDAGLDPFKLERCASGPCNWTPDGGPAPVPEPTTSLLWGTTAAGLALAPGAADTARPSSSPRPHPPDHRPKGQITRRGLTVTNRLEAARPHLDTLEQGLDLG